MNYKKLFDSPPNRRNSYCIKWDKNQTKFGRDDLIPLWIADMDFAAPEQVTQAIKERAEHGVFGYSYRTDDYVDAIVNWLGNIHSWQVEPRQLLFYPPGTVAAVNMLVNTLTEEGDEIIVQTPSYPPLMNVVKKNGRTLIENPLLLTDKGYRIDFEKFESQLTEKTKLFLFCSPHNPTGRVWSKEELSRLAKICKRYNVVVVSDEVHADLIEENKRHFHFERLEHDIKPPSVTIISSCKTFNMAALPQSTLICSDLGLRRKIQHQINNSQINLDGLFSAVATQAAYQFGEPWLRELREYIQENRRTLNRLLQDNLPTVKLVPAEGTYLAWLDFRELRLTNAETEKCLIEQAGIGLYNGLDFGETGDGFFRLNLACYRYLLCEAVNKIIDVFKSQ
ncbi:MAG: PatB family C-S lyase [Kangiellaceae bacterium]|nr:PatB family C-S lyase [Kangiellaceae bacterium]